MSDREDEIIMDEVPEVYDYTKDPRWNKTLNNMGEPNYYPYIGLDGIALDKSSRLKVPITNLVIFRLDDGVELNSDNIKRFR